jgi:2-polyprenyl-3-methyl-5-hydroxy-6-metoxy-1,4-benzoquinol methylase
MARLRYLARSIVRWTNPDRFGCPNCDSSLSEVVDQKYLVTMLRRCNDCSLLFRVPTDDPIESAQFYNKEYSQGFTTELPAVDQLQALKASNFAGSEKDYSYYLRILNELGVGSGARLFDFGCSWGYGTYQLARAGMDATAFEISRSRRGYAERELGVRLVLDMDRTIADPAHRGSYHCFFSSHVLEHVPSPHLVFDYAMKLLQPGGIFVSFTPNGSAACRKALKTWSQLWGEVHPNFIDDVFLDRSFANSPRAFGSSPLRGASLPADVAARQLDDLSGFELFFAARKVGESW